MSWFFFAIAAPALYAVSNFVDKFIIEKHIKNFVVLTILGGFISLPFALIILTLRHFPTYGLGQTILIILAGISMELALLPYFKAISLDDISRVVPVFQLIPVFVLIMSFLLLGERLTLFQFIGFWFVITGAYLVSLNKFGKGIFNLRKSFGWIILASVLWAIPTVIFKFVSVEQGFWDTMAYEFLGATVGAFILFLIPSFRRGFFEEVKTVKNFVWSILVSNEILYLFARLIGFYAIAIAPAVSLASALGGFMPFFSLVYGIILSVWFPYIVKEDIKKSTLLFKLIAIALIFVGVWFINA